MSILPLTLKLEPLMSRHKTYLIKYYDDQEEIDKEAVMYEEDNPHDALRMFSLETENVGYIKSIEEL